MAWTTRADISFEHKILWVSVLRRAVFDYVLYKGSGTHSIEWKRAFQYVFDKGVRYENGVSFEEVCDLFGWDPDYVRKLATKLTKSDIKKMETTQFREDFVFDVVESVVRQTERWKTSSFAIPFLPHHKYNESYREEVAPRVVSKETYSSRLPPPMIQWQATA